jgi:HEAT repeat protein
MMLVSGLNQESEAQEPGELVDQLKDPYPFVRIRASFALTQLNQEFCVELISNDQSLRELISAIGDSDEVVRRNAEHFFERSGPAGFRAVPALMAGLRDSETMVRLNAAGALGSMHGMAKKAVPLLESVR